MCTHELVIDDDPAFIDVASYMLRKQGYVAHPARTPEEAAAQAHRVPPEVVLLDWQMGGADGIHLIRPIRDILPRVPIVLVTATPSVDLAIRSIRAGAFDFLAKPIDEARLTMTLAKAVEHHRLAGQVDALRDGKAGPARFEEMIGTSPQMRTIYHIIANVAATDVNVMIYGESGTGKELVARAVHRRTARASAPFVPLNMGALPRELVESTLFGHERGAFTGADRIRIGAAEEARNGTLFLDEIGEMPLELQPKLLRFLQERAFRRVGGSADIRSECRIISATNRDPLAEVRAGRLRADLFYRLNVVPIIIPPLRERREDIPLLAMNALHTASGRFNKSFEAIDGDALGRLTAYNWPGNVRELVHVFERVVVLNDGRSVTEAMLPPHLLDAAVPPVSPAPAVAPAAAAAAPPTPEPTSPGPAIVPLAEMERRAIEHAMRACGGSAAEAARRLQISNATIYRKLKEYALADL
jgi:two-component system repressor protein LuxO